MRVARTVVLTPGQKEALEARTRARSASARSVERARIVLMAAAGMQDKQIAAELRIMPEKAARWRKRFLEGGMPALEKDAPRPGRTPVITPDKIEEVIRKTTREKPAGAACWSTRGMARAAGISEKSVRRIWRQHGLKPHLAPPPSAGTFEAVVGLYLNPPEHALVLCVGEKRRTPAPAGHSATATLLAALNTPNGSAAGLCDDRHRPQEWLRFLRAIDQAAPAGSDLYLVADGYATHKHPAVQRWLARHRRFHVHVAPPGSPWLNTVVLSGSYSGLRRDVIGAVNGPIAAIGNYIAQI